MEYIEPLLWLSLWPIVIFLGYKFAALNLRHYQKLERLEELENTFFAETHSPLSGKK